MNESIRKYSSTIAFLATFFITVIFFAVMILVKVPEKQKYKTIKINLAQQSVQTPVKKQEKVPEKSKAESSEPVSETKLAENKSVETPKNQESAAPKKTETVKTEPSKASSKKSESAPKKSESAPKESTASNKPVQTSQNAPAPEIKKSVEELAAEAAANKKAASWDDSLFDPFEDVADYDWNQAVAANNSSSIEGSAASSASAQASSTQTSSSKSTKSQSSSSSTSDALASLKTTSTSTAGRTSSVQYGSVSSKSDRVTIQTDDGKSRELLSPAKPEIKLSEESAKKITGTVTVSINIRIFADGTVPATYVTIKPVAVLPAEVQNEVKNIISQWKFVSDISEAYATLEYTIRVN